MASGPLSHTSHTGEFHTDLGTFIAHCATLVAFIDLSRPVYSLSRSSVYNSPSRSLFFLSSPFTLPPSIHPVLLLPALLSRCPASRSARPRVSSPHPLSSPSPPFPSSILLFPLSPSTPNSFINSTDDWASLCSCHGDARGGDKPCPVGWGRRVGAGADHMAAGPPSETGAARDRGTERYTCSPRPAP